MSNKIDKLLIIYNRFIEEYQNNSYKSNNINLAFRCWLEQQYDINNKLILLKFKKYLPSYINVY